MVSSQQSMRAEATRAHQAGDLKTAAKGYAAFLAAVPDDAVIWSNLGVLHRTCHRHEMALRCHRRAFALNPQDIGVRNNLSNTLSDIGQYAESIALRRGILTEVPNDPNHLAMIGRCYRGMGDYDTAIAHLRDAIRALPDDAELQMQLAFAQLGKGDFARAFETYKARWRAGELKPRALPFPEWQGEDLRGKRIVVLPEQGFGDAVLFMRFLPVLQGRGASVLVLAERPLQRLLSQLPDVTVVSADDLKRAPADVWINMMDLAALHFAGTAAIPAPTEVHIPDDARARARQIVTPFANAFKVGVIWSGSATYKGNAFRSFSHTDYLPLTDLPGVQLFSLYKGPYLEPFHADGTDALIIDTASTDRDFADCAATMAEMDLVITSDTVTAHIAGSMGIDVWTVLHWDPFWVWTHEGDKTPWYPGMRLFRQGTPLDWSMVMTEVKNTLELRLETSK